MPIDPKEEAALPSVDLEALEVARSYLRTALPLSERTHKDGILDRYDRTVAALARRAAPTGQQEAGALEQQLSVMGGERDSEREIAQGWETKYYAIEETLRGVQADASMWQGKHGDLWGALRTLGRCPSCNALLFDPKDEYAPCAVCAPARAALSGAAAAPPSGGLADDLRAAGWVVAVHNDYRQDGEARTFWLFTKEGRAVKGEGATDAEALNEIRRVLPLPEKPAAPPPSAETDRLARLAGQQKETEDRKLAAMSFAQREAYIKQWARDLAASAQPAAPPSAEDGDDR